MNKDDTEQHFLEEEQDSWNITKYVWTIKKHGKVISSVLNCDNIDAKSIRNKYEYSRFCRPSNRNIKEIIKLENNIVNLTDNYEFIRVSELVPIWLYRYLSWMSPHRSIQMNRELELCSDLSVSLALEWLLKRKLQQCKYAKIAWFNSTFRPQNFYGADNQKEVPYIHFSMYWNAIVWRDRDEVRFAKEFLPELLEHYLKIITDKNSNLSINNIEIVISYMPNTEDILWKYWKTLHEFRDYQLKERSKNWKEPTLNEYLWTDIIMNHPCLDSLIKENNKWLNLDIWYLISMYEEIKTLEEVYPVKIMTNIWRSRWAWQYSSIAFSIFWTSQNGHRMDIADWWITNRWNKLVSPVERCLVWGLGIDLLSNYYK